MHKKVDPAIVSFDRDTARSQGQLVNTAREQSSGAVSTCFQDWLVAKGGDR
jgi:hypothetical protein